MRTDAERAASLEAVADWNDQFAKVAEKESQSAKAFEDRDYYRRRAARLRKQAEDLRTQAHRLWRQSQV